MPHGNYKTIEDRFWSKVDKNQPSGCWHWLGRLHANGYGDMVIDGHAVMAHRVSYTINIGPIPEGAFVLHKCDNPRCVNPDHLFSGTQSDNLRDASEKGRNFFYRGHTYATGSKNGRSKLSEADVLFIRDNFRQFSLQELADKFGVHTGTISAAINGRGWKNLPPVQNRRRAGQSKLTSEQTQEILARKGEKRISELAREYGVTPAAIRYIFNKNR